MQKRRERLFLDSEQFMQLIILIVLLALSAFFSSAETALTTVNRIRIRSLAEEGNKKAKLLLKVFDQQSKMLSTVLVGNNIVNLSASSLMTILTTELFGSALVGVATGLLTVLVLIFGEITPKTYASVNAVKMSLNYVRIIYALMVILTPVVVVIEWMAGIVLKLFRTDKSKNKSDMTESEFLTIVDVTHEQGITSKEGKEIIKNVFDIDDISAREIMVPRIDVASIGVDASYEELMEIFEEYRFTRFPVYEEMVERIIGMINMKDILLYKQGNPFSIKDYMRKPLFTYEGKMADELLEDMRESGETMAIVVDEYGDAVGIITMEDLLEEIVGEIRDEFDEDEKNEIIKNKDGSYKIDASLSLEDINDRIGTKLESEEYDSLGGLLLEELGRLPEIGEEITKDGYHFQILQMDKNRIRRVKMKKLPNNIE